MQNKISKINNLFQSLLKEEPLKEKFKRITDGVVDIFDADFARIWITSKGDLCDSGCMHAEVKEGPHVCKNRDQCLHLISSSGRYTDLDGKIHKRVPFGCYKIGLVASGKDKKFIINDVTSDLRVHDQKWAKELGLVSFAGCRILSYDEKPIGVLALFSKKKISPAEDGLLESIANSTAQIIQSAAAQDSAKNREATIKAIVESLTESMCMIDEESNILWANSVAADMFGKKLEGQKCYSAYYDLDQECDNCIAKKSFADNKSREQEAEIVTETGEKKCLWCTSSIAEYYEDGRPKTVLEVFRDITDRKKIEDELKASETFLDNVIDNSLDSIAVSDQTGRITQVNRAFEQLVGYTREGLIGKSSVMISLQKAGTYETILGETVEIDQDTVCRGNDQIARLLKDGSIQNAEGYYVRKDGKIVPIENNITFLYGDHGERVGVVANIRDITKRKETETSLKITNSFLDNIIETSLDGIIVADTTGHLVRVNKAVLDLLGYDKDEMLGKAVHEFMFLDEGIYESSSGEKVKMGDHVFELGRKMLAELHESGRVNNWEMYFFTKDKKAIPTEQNVAFFKDEKGTSIGSVSIIRDITGRKKAENEIKKHRDHLNELVNRKTREIKAANNELQASYEQLAAGEESLRENEEKLRSIVRTASDAIITTDSLAEIISWNEAAEKIFGYTEKEVLGKPAFFILPERFRKEQHRQVEKKLQTPPPLELREQMELTGLRENGEEFPMEISRSSWQIEDYVYYTALIRDITKKKQAEKEIRETKDFLENIFKTTADGIVVTDDKGSLLRVNKAMEKMTGFTEKELQGTYVKELMPQHKEGEDMKILSDSIKKLQSEIELSDYKVLWPRKDGSFFPVEINKSLLKDKEGNTTGAVGVVRDITERKKIKDQLLRSEKLRSLGELAGGVAHDFNNVLAAVLGRAQLLKRKVERLQHEEANKKIEKELKEGLEIIEGAALDGAETVRRIQEFARKREDDKYFTAVDLNRIIKDAIEFTKIRWKDDSERKGYKYQVKNHITSLPSILGSASELREVFVNLINNALDAMPAGGSINVFGRLQYDKIEIKFKDTGEGIQPGIRETIFDPFFTTKGPQATGLGMSVSFGIIDRHHGTIRVESSVGEGTVFTIILPVSGKKVEHKTDFAETGQTRKASILIAEDEKDVLDVLRDILESEGHLVETVSHGKDALEIFLKKEFDLVFTDLGMPGMPGWEIAEEIKKIKDVPVILMTGWEIKNSGVNLKKTKVDLLISKPFKVDEILTAVKQGLEIKEKTK